MTQPDARPRRAVAIRLLALGGLVALAFAVAVLVVGAIDSMQGYNGPPPGPPRLDSVYRPTLVTASLCAGIVGLLSAWLAGRRPRVAAVLAAVAIVAGFAAAVSLRDEWWSHVSRAVAALAWPVPAGLLGAGALLCLSLTSTSSSPAREP